jgi:maltooligosyltrehalose trehalohydrolase
MSRQGPGVDPQPSPSLMAYKTVTGKNMQNAALRRMPIGAEILPEGGANFRVWADLIQRLSVIIFGGIDEIPREEIDLQPEGDGYFSGFVAEAKTGDLYLFRLDGRPEMYSDPASRFQPRGPLGPSQLIDPGKFAWADADWKGITREDQVLYEMHVGTFTGEGTFAAASEEFAELADLGIEVIEVMPVADFPGRFGWGYDGVNLFAPTRLYGEPDDLRRFVDRAHAAGIGVILDVVYNHLGPAGQNLERYSEHYFTDRYQTDWGRAMNFDGPHSAPVREYFLANAAYWIDEFHFDGLRLDATQSIYDSSEDHILGAIARQVRTAAKGRGTLLIAENEPQDTRLLRPSDKGGYSLDALWNDDFHHSAKVAMTGHNEAYYSDYRGAPQEFISTIKYGYLYQGQWYLWQKKRRGTPGLDLPPGAFVNFIQNHDQIANSVRSLRCHQLTSPGLYRAITALLLLTSSKPLLFQGQEFAASSPFCYFADHTPDLAALLRKGRTEFLAQFPSLATPEIQSRIPDPVDPKTFEQCKLDFSERQTHAGIYALHRDLLRLRREHSVFRREWQSKVDGAVLGPKAFVLRFFGEEDDDRLLVVNLGLDLPLNPAPEPLLAPPAGGVWRVLWSSEDPAYGGCGALAPENENKWRIQGQAAIVLIPEKA